MMTEKKNKDFMRLLDLRVKPEDDMLFFIFFSVIFYSLHLLTLLKKTIRFKGRPAQRQV